MPPIEAALAGNIVLGYPGWGGREYWHEPNFRSVRFGDMRDFVRKFHEVSAYATRPGIEALLAPARAQLAACYGLDAETALLRAAVERIHHPQLKRAA